MPRMSLPLGNKVTKTFKHLVPKTPILTRTRYGKMPPKAHKRTTEGAKNGNNLRGHRIKSGHNKKAPVYSDELIAKALERTGGLRSHAANLIGCTVGTICDRINKTPALQRVIVETQEKLLDAAEQGILKGCNRGKGWAVMFTLDRKGADRGWRDPSTANGPYRPDGFTGIPTNLAEWPDDALDRLISAINVRLDIREEQGKF